MLLLDFNKKFRKFKYKEAKLCKQMERLRQQFIIASKNFVNDWYYRYIENTVKNYPEITNSLQLDGVKSIKKELCEVIRTVQNLLENKMIVKELWSHFYKETDVALESYLYSVKRPKMVDEIIRSSFFEVVPLLARYGYEEAALELQTILTGPLRHDDRLDWSAAMHAIVKSYSNLHKQLIDFNVEIKNIESKKSFAEAVELWK